jgi:hypothetical protein
MIPSGGRIDRAYGDPRLAAIAEATTPTAEICDLPMISPAPDGLWIEKPAEGSADAYGGVVRKQCGQPHARR